jgi:fumarate reductase flavoprotein subunit
MDQQIFAWTARKGVRCRFCICRFLPEVTVQTITTDIAVIGTGLRTAIAAAEANPELDIALISKVYLMRSHTVAEEGGSAAVIKDEDSLDNHFNDTVGGGN